MHGLRPGPNGIFRFDPQQLAACQEQALAVDDGAELYAMVREMVGLSSFLEEKGSVAAAEALTKMAEPVITKLDAVAHGEAERNQKVAKLIRKQTAARRQTGTADALNPTNIGVSLRRK